MVCFCSCIDWTAPGFRVLLLGFLFCLAFHHHHHYSPPPTNSTPSSIFVGEWELTYTEHLLVPGTVHVIYACCLILPSEIKTKQTNVVGIIFPILQIKLELREVPTLVQNCITRSQQAHVGIFPWFPYQMHVFYHWSVHHVGLNEWSFVDLILSLCDTERAQRLSEASNMVWVIPPDGETMSSLEKGQKKREWWQWGGKEAWQSWGARRGNGDQLGDSGVVWFTSVFAGWAGSQAHQSWSPQQQTGCLFFPMLSSSD